MKRAFLILSALVMFAALGLAPTEASAKCGNSNGQVAGAVVGGLAGAFLGRSIDGGKHKIAGTLIGGAVGTFVGGQIGKSLDRCEQEKMAQATKSALDARGSGATSAQTWASETRENVNGSVSASPPQSLADGRICRNVTRVNYIDGQEMQDNPRFCKTPPDTSWAPA
ncbi:RT0821/Lpp0805 family surface protein [soil metagenome]